MKVNLFDSHTHSNNSHDGNDSVEKMCEVAMKKHIMGFCITDHFECEHEQIEIPMLGIANSIASVAKAKKEFAGRIRLTQGVEIGQGHLYQEISEKVMALGNYDFVIGSVHTMSNGKDAIEIDFSDPNVSVDEMLTAYFEDVYAMTKWNKFDTLGHLTYPERYITGKYGIPVDYSKYSDHIDSILNNIIDNGKSLEINTQGVRRGLGKTAPEFDVVKRYRQLGGELITIGSDAHSAEEIGADVDDTMNRLMEEGYRYFSFYRQRDPIMLRII